MSKRRLSIFVDESGILSEPDNASRFYVLTLVLHDQDVSITDLANDLDRDLSFIGIANLCFHAGPVIHANDQFEFMNWDLRRKIFSRMIAFARRADFRYHCLDVDKKFVDSSDATLAKLNMQLDEFLAAYQSALGGYDDIKVYYDCGQKQITNFLLRFFAEHKELKVEFAHAVEPRKYRLFQVADLVCTLHLLELKLANGLPFSRSEFKFFGGPKKFRHDFLRPIKAKEFSKH